jgi:hypothetical protein
MNLNETLVKIDLTRLTTPQLVELYNRHSTKPVRRFADRRTAEKRTSALLEQLKQAAPAAVVKQRVEPAKTAAGTPRAAAEPKRAAMATSLKLDRRVVLLQTSQVWPNAHQMWRQNPDWMTSAQQDRLTQRLYAAAKASQRDYVRVGERTFCLLQVPGCATLTPRVLEKLKQTSDTIELTSFSASQRGEA